nr:TPA_asm: m87.4 sORF 5 [Murid betaherpesvirus 1]DBA08026.1 TPA_asm: m87.4 sORF 5 [Murid betaherpesvirus 1]
MGPMSRRQRTTRALSSSVAPGSGPAAISVLKIEEMCSSSTVTAWERRESSNGEISRVRL